MTKNVSIAKFKQSFELVGQYMSYYANMESSLDRAIGSALGLTVVQELIVCSNLPFHSKCNILRSAIKLINVSTKDKHLKNIANASKSSADRNMIAHSQFYPDETEVWSVKFIRYRAESELKIEPQIWNRMVFLNEFDKLESISKMFDELSGILVQAEYVGKLKDKFNGQNALRLLGGLGDS